MRVSGIIIKTKDARRGNYDVTARFFHKNKYFESCDVYDKSMKEFYKIDVGDTVIVEFIENDPTINRIDEDSFKKRL